MLNIKDCVVLIVDVQGKLAQLMHDKDALFKNIQTLIKAARILDIPIISCEQNPAGLGATVDEIAELLTEHQPVAKFSFSCCGDENFNDTLKACARKQILLCGIEAHVCVYQTAIDLLHKGYEVYLIIDAVSSRDIRNKEIAVERMNTDGANLSCVEMALFELLKTAKHPKFKQIASLIK